MQTTTDVVNPDGLTTTMGTSVSGRVRIEKGAAGLASFAESLSHGEWYRPVPETDRRSVGVVIHHVSD